MIGLREERGPELGQIQNAGSNPRAEVRPANKLSTAKTILRPPVTSALHLPSASVTVITDNDMCSWKMWQRRKASISGVKDALRSIPRYCARLR